VSTASRAVADARRTISISQLSNLAESIASALSSRRDADLLQKIAKTK
jgi:hypothetical protein